MAMFCLFYTHGLKKIIKNFLKYFFADGYKIALS